MDLHDEELHRAKDDLFKAEAAVLNQGTTIWHMHQEGERRVAAYHAKLQFRKAQVEYVAELARRKVEAAAAAVAADRAAYRQAMDILIPERRGRGRRTGRSADATDIAR